MELVELEFETRIRFLQWKFACLLLSCFIRKGNGDTEKGDEKDFKPRVTLIRSSLGKDAPSDERRENLREARRKGGHQLIN